MIDRVERAVNEFESRDYLYEALPLLAEAQARLGRIEEAKRTALSIGEGPTTSELDLRDGQPYAL